MPTLVDIEAAKAQLSELVEAAKSGEEVVITQDGMPLAKLMPVDERTVVDRKARRQKIDEILARIDALPILNPDFDLEWDENGLPI